MLSRKMGLPVYTLISGKGSFHLPKYMKTVKIPKGNIGPDRFISLIKHASYVVTDSFHGTAFSIVFHKPFCAISHINQDGIIICDLRIYNLLEKVNLCKQYVTSDKVSDAVENGINWAEVDELRNIEIAHSIDYLHTVVENCNCL